MDSARGRQHYSYKAFKASSPSNLHHESNSCNTQPNYGIIKARIQKQTLKLRKNYFCRGSYRSKFPYSKNDISNKKPNKTAEDVEEEERKKKLTDTAKKLLSKLKTWNAEKNCYEDNLLQYCNTNEVLNENSCKHNEERINSEEKPKRIAHSKKTKLVKGRTRKTFSQPAKTITRYDVNKETVKDFQNRIQHKLIEEIMQMPKENLQNVLNDPKINPIMELKMSRLVKENKPLIAQKLRALAESKMKSLDYSSNPTLLIDIDKLIDPVIETDLSALPYELIKQMENIFQVKFDYSQSNEVSEVDIDVTENEIGKVVMMEDIAMEVNNLEQIVKAENNEDLSLYECSTDEDDETSASKLAESEQKHSSLLNESLTQGAGKSEKKSEETKQKTPSGFFESFGGNNIETETSPLKVSLHKGEKFPQEPENVDFVDNCLLNDNLVSSQGTFEEPNQSSSKSMGEFTSKSCQTDCNTGNASTQTQTTSEIVETLYGVPIPKEAADASISSLVKEINSIQSLTNKLNERRLMIFLELARMSPSGSFITDEFTKKNFIETLSNGNFCLIESLKHFFSFPQEQNHKYSEYRSSGVFKTPGQRKNKNRLRNRHNKRNSGHP